MRLRLMLDTNILISAFVFRSEPYNVIIRLLNERHKLCVSEYIDHEFRDKIFSKWPDKAKMIIGIYNQYCFPVYSSDDIPKIRLRDPKDEQVLCDAISVGVDILLTGDKDIYESDCKEIKIMCVKDLIDYLDKM